ncbi:MAG: hypothetical protein CVT94_06035 [Bacteroidetes bacterium HGW-Bacteroidetes-11]|nr:MAG: hypothetical protein CVT94_06035 [Bacteroidetes bacterium HGW-Bacteroidetes-11]
MVDFPAYESRDCSRKRCKGIKSNSPPKKAVTFREQSRFGILNMRISGYPQKKSARRYNKQRADFFRKNRDCNATS